MKIAELLYRGINRVRRALYRRRVLKPKRLVLTKAANWGQFTDTYSGVGGPRVIQLGAKFYF